MHLGRALNVRHDADMKTDELLDSQLDAWVVRAIDRSGNPELIGLHKRYLDGVVPFKPSRSGAQAAHVIALSGVVIEDMGDGEFWASARYVAGGHVQSSGATQELAALRAFVKSQFGDDLIEAP